MLIWSRRSCLCGKLISSNTALFEMDGWFSWRVIDVFFFSLYLCLCVCAECLQPAVPIWWSDLGSIMSAAGFLSHWYQLLCGWSETICSRRTLSHHSSEGCGSISTEFTQLLLISAFESISIIVDHRSGHSKPYRLPCRQFNDRQPEMWARSYAVCLERIHRLRLFV